MWFVLYVTLLCKGWWHVDERNEDIIIAFNGHATADTNDDDARIKEHYFIKIDHTDVWELDHTRGNHCNKWYTHVLLMKNRRQF